MAHVVPFGTESARPFLPALDFATSKAFYEALGFAKELDGDDVAIYRIGSTSFLLQRHYQKEWAENFMMQLLVDDLDAWWAPHRVAGLACDVRRGRAEAADDAALGPAHCLRRRSVGGALARGPTPARGRARPLGRRLAFGAGGHGPRTATRFLSGS